MTTDATDETIERIENTLAENGQPLPKAAPTQYGINQRPTGIPSNLYFLEELLRRTPVSQLHEVLPEEAFFKLRCRQCNFRFRSVECPLELAHLHSKWNDHSVVCTLHVGEYEVVTETLPVIPMWRERYPHLFGIPTRFYRSLWCAGMMLLFLAYTVYGVLNESGTDRWWSFLMTGVWSYNCYLWWENRRERRKEKDR